jgi:multiple sugar transport system ATP-binding protein
MNFVEMTIAESNGALWAESPGLRIRIPPARSEALRRHSATKIVLGIRPEALRIATGADSADYAFDSVVEVVEPLGNEILLDMRAGTNLMVARVDPATRVKVRDKVRLALDAERLHFFDPQSEAAI